MYTFLSCSGCTWHFLFVKTFIVDWHEFEMTVVKYSGVFHTFHYINIPCNDLFQQLIQWLEVPKWYLNNLSFLFNTILHKMKVGYYVLLTWCPSLVKQGIIKWLHKQWFEQGGKFLATVNLMFKLFSSFSLNLICTCCLYFKYYLILNYIDEKE